MHPDERAGSDEDLVVETNAACLEVFEGVLAGDREAMALVYQRFMVALSGKAERLIPARHASKIEPVSIVHSVMESLLNLDAQARDRLACYHIHNWAQLYGLLVQMTVRKCLNRIRKFDTQTRASQRERPLNEAIAVVVAPSAEDEAAFAELLDRLRAEFDTLEYQIICLSMEGHSIQEIADAVELSTTTVKNVRRKLTRWLRRRLEEQE